MEIPASPPSPDRWGLAAILLPVIALVAYMIVPFLHPPASREVATFLLIACLIAVLLSVPFGIGVAISGKKGDRRRVRKGITGSALGLLSGILIVLASSLAIKKAREIEARDLQKRGEAPARSVPTVPD